MFTVHALRLNPHPSDVFQALQRFDPHELLIAQLFRQNDGWWLEAPSLRLAGTFKNDRLKIQDLTLKTPAGLDVMRHLVKKCKGTLIGLLESTWEPVYIERGREEKVSLVDFYDRYPGR